MRDRYILEWYWDGEPRIYKTSVRRQDIPDYIWQSGRIKDWLKHRLETRYGIAGFKLLQWYWD